MPTGRPRLREAGQGTSDRGCLSAVPTAVSGDLTGEKSEVLPPPAAHAFSSTLLPPRSQLAAKGTNVGLQGGCFLA